MVTATHASAAGRSPSRIGLRLGAALTVVLLALAPLSEGAAGAPAQPPPPTAPPTPSPGTATAPPAAPDIAGTWSVTRSWLRSCPACRSPVVRTTTWLVAVDGGDVTIARGPRGTLRPDGQGGGLLDLEGLETEGDFVLRLAYATLRVDAAGAVIEGAFGGSERGGNPCGGEPPIVTCFVSSGWLRAVRVAAPGTPTGAPTTASPPATPATPIAATATPTASAAATATPTASATASVAATAMPTASATASATATARPFASACFLPYAHLP